MRYLYPDRDADIAPGDWTHKVLECLHHGNAPHARAHERRTDMAVVPFRCVVCMRDGSASPWFYKKAALPYEFPSEVAKDANGPATDVSKPSNPKDVAAQTRAPVGLVPVAALVEESLAFFEGLLKYGQASWMIAGVRSSVYVFACMRHLLRWYMGQTRDPKSGVHHLGSARACLAILLDSEARGVLQDDRPPTLDQMDDILTQAEATMAKLTEMYGAVQPKHWTINDKE